MKIGVNWGEKDFEGDGVGGGGGGGRRWDHVLGDPEVKRAGKGKSTRSSK